MDLESLAEKYKPIVYFHSDEKYFPSTIQDYILNSQLMYKDDVKLECMTSPHDIVDFNEDTQNLNVSNINYSVKLIDKPERRKYGAEWFVKKTESNKDYYSEKPKFYVYFIQSEIGNLDIIDIIYLFTYPYNGTLKSHKYDEEICVVKLVNGVPYRIGGSAHGNMRWWGYGNPSYRPEVYIAKGSHAVYHKPINHTRLFFFGNDVADKGYKVDDYDLVVIDPLKIPYEYNYLNFVGARNYKEWGHFTPRQRSYIDPINYSPLKHSMTIVNQFLDDNILIHSIVWCGMILPLGPIIYFNYSMVNDYNTPAWMAAVNMIFGFISFTLAGVYYTVRTNTY